MVNNFTRQLTGLNHQFAEFYWNLQKRHFKTFFLLFFKAKIWHFIQFENNLHIPEK